MKSVFFLSSIFIIFSNQAKCVIFFSRILSKYMNYSTYFSVWYPNTKIFKSCRVQCGLESLFWLSCEEWLSSLPILCLCGFAPAFSHISKTCMFIWTWTFSDVSVNGCLSYCPAIDWLPLRLVSWDGLQLNKENGWMKYYHHSTFQIGWQHTTKWPTFLYSRCSAWKSTSSNTKLHVLPWGATRPDWL